MANRNTQLLGLVIDDPPLSQLKTCVQSTKNPSLKERLEMLDRIKHQASDAQENFDQTLNQIKKQASLAQQDAIDDLGDEIIASLKRLGNAYSALEASSKDPPKPEPFISKVTRTLRQSFPPQAEAKNPAMPEILLKGAQVFYKNGDHQRLETDVSLRYNEKEGYILQAKREDIVSDTDENSAKFYLAPECSSRSFGTDEDLAQVYFIPQNITSIAYTERNGYVEHVVLRLRGSMLQTLYLIFEEWESMCETVEKLELESGVKAEW